MYRKYDNRKEFMTKIPNFQVAHSIIYVILHED